MKDTTRAALAVILAFAAAALAWRPRRLLVTGDSMRPSLLPGDRVLAIRARRVRAGDVVAVPDPRDAGRLLVKRVAAVRGDGVELAGDHAEASTDSRVFGPVSHASIRGRVVYRYAPAERSGPVR